MPDNPTENQGQHTSNNDEGVRLRAVENEAHDLKNSVFGNEQHGNDGLIKRVKEIETGKLRKIENLQWVSVTGIVITAIAAVFTALYNWLGK